MGTSKKGTPNFGKPRNDQVWARELRNEGVGGCELRDVDLGSCELSSTLLKRGYIGDYTGE